MEIVTLAAESRMQLGTKRSRRIREAGKVPAIIYGHRESPEAVSVDRHNLEIALHHGVHVLKLEMKDHAGQYLIRAVQYDHLSTTPIHLDLARVDMNERVKVTVGIELKGAPKGTQQGGILEQFVTEIEVECMVSDIPEMIRPNVTDMLVGDMLHLRDLDLGPGVTAVPHADEIICAVRLPSGKIAAGTHPSEAVEEPTQPELIRRAKEEPEGGAK